MQKIIFLLLFALLGLGAAEAQSADTIRVMTYNLLQYGVTSGPSCTPSPITSKNAWLNLILGYVKPDLLACNELRWNVNNAYALNLKTNAMGYNAAMDLTTAGNSAGSEIANMLFYNTNKFGYLKHEAITGNVRDIDVYKLYHKGATTSSDSSLLWVIVAHLKAGSASADANARAVAAADIMTWLNERPYIKNYMLMGDLNLYGSSEGAYQNLTKSTDPMRLYDPTGVTTGWQSSAYAALHTQCPSTSSANCFSGGGLDDRFDFILMSNALMNNTAGIGYVSNSYKAFGNTGNSYNTNLNCSQLGTTVCSALTQNSDHLPVIADLRINMPVGIQPPLASQVEINVLENPVVDYFRLQCVFHKQTPIRLNLYDNIGKWVAQYELNPQQQAYAFDLGAFRNGIYFLTAESPEGTYFVQKIVKL